MDSSLARRFSLRRSAASPFVPLHSSIHPPHPFIFLAPFPPRPARAPGSWVCLGGRGELREKQWRGASERARRRSRPPASVQPPGRLIGGGDGARVLRAPGRPEPRRAEITPLAGGPAPDKRASRGWARWPGTAGGCCCCCLAVPSERGCHWQRARSAGGGGGRAGGGGGRLATATMGRCNGRCTLVGFCCLQLVSAAPRRALVPESSAPRPVPGALGC